MWREIKKPTPSIDAYLYLQNNPAKFHPDPIWNNGTLDFLDEVAINKKNKNNNNKMSSDMRSVHDLKR